MYYKWDQNLVIETSWSAIGWAIQEAEFELYLPQPLLDSSFA